MLDVAEQIVHFIESKCLNSKVWNPFCESWPYRLTLTVEVMVLLPSNVIASFFFLFLVLHFYISFSLFCLCRFLFETQLYRQELV
jgi:hypothetical protein